MTARQIRRLHGNLYADRGYISKDLGQAIQGEKHETHVCDDSEIYFGFMCIAVG